MSADAGPSKTPFDSQSQGAEEIDVQPVDQDILVLSLIQRYQQQLILDLLDALEGYAVPFRSVVGEAYETVLA